MDNKGRWVAVWIGLFLVISTVVGFLIKGIIDNALYNRFPDRGVPRINIDLNGVSLDEIKSGSKEMKYEGNDLQIYNGGEILEYGGVEVKGRGNSTWDYAKKPYQIGFDNKVDLFKLGKAKKWVLLASRADYTLLRNDIAFKLAEMVELQYNHRGKYIELYYNGKYEGLYYLIQKIDIAKGSIDLNKNEGILFEMDNVYADENSEGYYKTGSGDILVLKDIKPDNKKTKDSMIKAFLDDMNKLECAIEKKDYSEVSEIADMDSFAKYFLVNEFTVNPDAYSTSFYLYKDGMDGRICAGPVWDFDLAFANRNWTWGIDERFYSPSEEMIRRREAFGEYDLMENKHISKIMYYLMEIPEFREEIKKVFSDNMSGRLGELMTTINNGYSKTYKAILENNKKWEIKNYKEEYDYLLNWIIKRFAYFEYKYGDDSNEINGQKHFQFL